MINFFQLFNIEQNFFIDRNHLESKLFQFQSQFHPDKSSAKEIEKSIQINEGYKILADDFLRACHILKLNGIDILADEKAIKINQSILIEVLELQENIADCDDFNRISDLEIALKKEIEEEILKAVKLFADNKYNDAAQILVRVKYFKKSLKDLKDKKKEIKNGA